MHSDEFLDLNDVDLVSPAKSKHFQRKKENKEIKDGTNARLVVILHALIPYNVLRSFPAPLKSTYSISSVVV